MRADRRGMGDERQRFGVVGAPHVVAGSLSPVMMTAAFASMGIDATYDAIAIEDGDDAGAALRRLARTYAGCNVTMPYKRTAARIATEVTARVRASGAANTLRFDVDGTISADATDGIALVEAVAAHDLQLDGARVAILGAGGAATEAAVACVDAGVAAIDLWNRTPRHAHQLAELLHKIAPAMPLQVHIDLPIREAVHFVIGCVPTSALTPEMCIDWQGDPSFVDYAYVRDGDATPLMVAAESRDARCIDGRELLVRQGTAALRHWFEGARPPIEVMLRAVR